MLRSTFKELAGISIKGAKEAKRDEMQSRSKLARLAPCLNDTFACPSQFGELLLHIYAIPFKSEDVQTEKLEKNVHYQLDVLENFRRAMAGEPENDT